MKTLVSTLYFYIAKQHDGIEWYLMDLDDHKFAWTRSHYKGIKQLSESNLIRFMEEYLPGRKDVYIKGISDLIEIAYNEWSF